MIVLQQFFKFFQLLHSETGRNQLAAGFMLGLFMGFTPTSAYLLWITYFVLLFMWRINFGAAFFAAAVFKVLALALDPFFDRVGLYLLTAVPPLKEPWTTLFHAPIVPYSYFYNTIVMGSLAIALVAAIPVFLVSRVLVEKYRVAVVTRFQNSKPWKALKATKLYGLYVKYTQYEF